MLSRLYDERVFTSSDDVVFSASTAQALLGLNGARHGTTRRTSRQAVKSSRRPMPLEEEEESKSDQDNDDDASSGGQKAPADDELEDDEEEVDDEEDGDEKKRTAGLKFPLQSPRHIAASQSYIHHQRRRVELGEGSASPGTRRRHLKKLLNGDYNADDDTGVGSQTARQREGVVTLAADAPLSKDLMPRKIHVQYHDHPMELVYLPTGEIRSRDECPPGLRLPATTDVRKLLETPLSPGAKEKVRRRVQSTFAESAASSTVHITRQDKDPGVVGSEQWQQDQPDVTRTSGSASVKAPRQMGRRQTRQDRDDSDDADSPESDNDVDYADADRHRSAYSKTRTTYLNTGKRRAGDGARAVGPHPQSEMHREDSRAAGAGKSNTRKGREEPASEEESVAESRIKQSRHSKSSADRNLEVELQKEKKRVLQKMTQLLEEQGKNQALQHQLQIFQDKVTAMEKELEIYARRGATNTSREDSNVRERDERIRVLLEQVQSKDELIRRTQSQLEQSERLASTNARTDKSSPRYEDKITRLRQREAAIAKQLEDLMNRVTEFHSQVECWKVNSREALEGCDKRADVLELMDRLWMDFPPFIPSSDPPARKTSTEGESSTVAILTKKLRQKEDELRTTHVKYVELKELCARQCIREADLQNFINEHRLRGNLVIRKANNNSAGVRAGPGRDAENHHHGSNGQTNAMDEPHYGNQETDSNDGDESDPGGDLVVQRPRVFIDVKRSNQQNGTQQESFPIEHVRLAPSPALAQRYRQQQQQQQHAAMKQSTARTGIAQSGRTTRADTVASASRTLATTRQTLTTRTSTTQKRVGTTVGVRAAGTGRSPSMASKTPSARASMTSRRPSQAPLTSRPWV